MITLSATFTGTPDTADKRAALLVIFEENARRAGLTPPLAALPFGTNAEIKASWEIAWSLRDNERWAALRDAGPMALFEHAFTGEQKAAMKQNFSDRIASGEAAADIVTDTAS